METNLIWMRGDPIDNARFQYFEAARRISRRFSRALQFATAFENLCERPFNLYFLFTRKRIEREDVRAQQIEILSVRFFIPSIAAIAVEDCVKNADCDHECFLERRRVIQLAVRPLPSEGHKAFPVRSSL